MLAPTSRWRCTLLRAGRLELIIVQRIVPLARYRIVRFTTNIINLLGNGWVYAPLAGAIFLAQIRHPVAVLQAALLSTLIAHLFYRVLKQRVARLRPFERDPALRSLTKVLDKYSFPSGHCMTLTTALVPIAHAAPATLPLAAGALALLALCRLIAAHHYPSDVLAGIGLGAAIALPVSAWLVPA
ncbi:phosphatase PAP2 family protein [Massilia sp. DJPM01]|uniref:phosphatase PAP2 family protein n=1 Tax=Massilia sp. DJPM01 TaxID=3024404 RepID=UPI00259F98CB|nr:phosphatase PAP2 family protein [Massilia sp. DJPM01]